MKNFSNTYILLLSAIMAVVVASGLSVVVLYLQPIQEKNINLNNKQNILLSLNIESTKENALQKYDKYIIHNYVLNAEGEKIKGVDAFLVNLSKEMSKPMEKRKLPIFVASVENSRKYIIPARGKGLWGPIWGYIALNDNFNTIYGAYFGHESETPGLGAQITTRQFQKQFIDKKIFNSRGKFVSIKVYTGGTPSNNPHSVNGISGATITTNSVENMLKNTIMPYVPYLKKNAQKS